MEEVWKDIHIAIASLPDTPIIPLHPSPHRLRGIIFQDFLNNNNTNNNDVEDTILFNNDNNNNNNTNNDSSTLRSSILEFLSPTHPSQSTPTTASCSTNNNHNNNTHEFQFFDNQHVSKQGNNSSFSGLLGMNNNAGTYDALVSSSFPTTFGGGGSHRGDGCGAGVALTNNRKRFNESGGVIQDEDESVERRHKRMIKNRESSARSRARKQAYITELEMEVAQLSKENAMLRKQQRQLVETPPAHQLPRKYGLHRTSTAPF